MGYRKKPRSYRRYRKGSGGRLKKLERKVAKLSSNAEIKRAQQELSPGVINNGGHVVVGAIVESGSEYNQRTGQKIGARTYDVRCSLTQGTSYDTTNVRIIWLVDKRQNYNSPPTITTVLSSASILAPYHPEYRGKYRILSDRVHTLVPWDSSYKVNKLVHQTLKLNCPMSYYSDDVLMQNGLYCILISDKPTGGYGPTVSFLAELAFTDN
jgi:hypothetical protein